VTQITNADLFTQTDLKNLFTCSATTLPVEGGVTYWPLGSPIAKPAGAQQVDLYVPQANSGTLKFWASKMGFDATALNPCLHQTILSGPAASVAVEEHDGSAYASDPMALGPFSIAQWVAQSNGHNDRRHTAIIHSIDGVAPTASGALNPAFPILREVYNVVLFSSIDPTSATFDPLLAGLLSGSGSRLCGAGFTIRSFGFATLPNSALPDACGATTSTLRVNL
jgi:phosphate transport system substrate-binding protein